MYNVTDNYKNLIEQPVRYVSIYGAVLLSSGELVSFTDKNLISGSLSITHKLNRNGDFRPGGVYSSELSIGFTGLFARTNDLDGAAIKLNFRIYPDSEMNPSEAETVKLGQFYVDGSTIKRSGSAIRLKANDGLMLFDIEATARSGTLYELVTGSCDAAGISFGMTQEQFEALPNATISATINTSRIQNERDLLMFAAAATGSFARMSRDGELEFIPLTCKLDETSGAAIPAREILGNVRFSTDFSDDKTRISKMFMRRNGMALYSTLTATGSQKLAHLELEENPLMAGLSDSEVKTALNDILRQIYVCVNRVFNVEFNGDPALEVGDYVKLRGGSVDVDRGYAFGMITSQVWRYHGQHTIKCTLPASLVYVADSTAKSRSVTATPPERSVTKSQIEKRVDAMGALLDKYESSFTLTEYKYLTDLSVKFNGTTYTAEKDGATGLISRISDDAGNEFEPTLNSGITDVSMHNAAFLAVAMLSGLGNSTIMPVTAGLVGYFDYKRQCTAALWTNRLGGDNIPITGSAAVNAECLQMPSSAYGLYDLTYTDGQLSLYVVCKVSQDDGGFYQIVSNAGGNWSLQGSLREITSRNKNLYFTGNFDTYSTDLYKDGSTVSAEEYHIITLTQDAARNLKIYLDGAVVWEKTFPAVAFGNRWGLNCRTTDTTVYTTGHMSHFKMFAIGRTAHTAEQIATNAAWLKKYYGL